MLKVFSYGSNYYVDLHRGYFFFKYLRCGKLLLEDSRMELCYKLDIISRARGTKISLSITEFKKIYISVIISSHWAAMQSYSY